MSDPASTDRAARRLALTGDALGARIRMLELGADAALLDERQARSAHRLAVRSGADVATVERLAATAVAATLTTTAKLNELGAAYRARRAVAS